ncbi:MAG: hypothetical protein FWG66_05430, partial [Spirochaetes bacterium]|nr:hypothetical protein [Spirochaetota bacterium]
MGRNSARAKNFAIFFRKKLQKDLTVFGKKAILLVYAVTGSIAGAKFVKREGSVVYTQNLSKILDAGNSCIYPP